MKYFGPKANKALSYGVASVSGTILAVCSCTVLPLFGSIYMRGAGLGTGDRLPLFRPGNQCPGDRIDGAGARLAARARARSRRGRVQRRHRAPDALDLPEGRAGQGGVDPGRVSRRGRRLTRGRCGTWGSISSRWSASSSSPTGRDRSESTGLWSAVFAVKWKITAAFAILLALSLWRFFKVRLLVSCARRGSGRGDRACGPAVSDRGLRGRVGGAGRADLLRRRRAERLAGSDVGIREADSAPAPRRRSRGGLLPRQSGEHGCGNRSQQMDPGARGRFAALSPPDTGKAGRLSISGGWMRSGRCGPTSSRRSPAL